MKPPSAFEQQVLDFVLRELRQAVEKKGQVTVIIDPFLRGGAHIYAFPNTGGRSYTIEPGT